MAEPWKEAWDLPAFRRQLLATVPLLLAVLLAFSRFVVWVERREGATLADPVLSHLPPRNFAGLVFVLVYGGILLGLGALRARPARLLLALQGYALMLLARMAAMFAAPLNPPPGIIPLADPMVRHLGTGAVLTRDLFFSGHTATLVLLALASERRILKSIFALGAAVAAVCLLWQHVHYTVDVLSAPFFAYGSFRLAVLLQRRAGLEPE